MWLAYLHDVFTGFCLFFHPSDYRLHLHIMIPMKSKPLPELNKLDHKLKSERNIDGLLKFKQGKENIKFN